MTLTVGARVTRNPASYPHMVGVEPDTWWAETGEVRSITVNAGQKFARVKWRHFETFVPAENLRPAREVSA